MLRNPAYKGTACFGKTRHLPTSGKKTTRYHRLYGQGKSSHSAQHRLSPEKWIRIPVPALISEETFAMAQELLDQNKKLSLRRTLNPSLLQGLVYCQKCSYSFQLTSQHRPTRQYRYYRCVGSHAWIHPNKKAVCDQKSIRQDKLDDIVWTEVVKLIEDPTLIQAEIDRRLEVVQNSLPAKQQQEKLNVELIRVQKNMDRLITAYQEELVSLDEIRTRLPELRQREKGIKAQLQSTTIQAENILASLKLVETLSAFQSRLRANAVTLDILDRQKIVRLLVREVAVSDDTITIRHCVPVQPIAGNKRTPPRSKSDNSSENYATANKNYLLCSYRQHIILLTLAST